MKLRYLFSLLMLLAMFAGCERQRTVYVNGNGQQTVVDQDYWESPTGQGYIQPDGAIHYANGYYDPYGSWHYQYNWHPIITAALWTAAMPSYYNPRTNITIYNGHSYSGNHVREYLSSDSYTRTRFKTTDPSRYNYKPSTSFRSGGFGGTKSYGSGGSYGTTRPTTSFNTQTPRTSGSSSGSSGWFSKGSSSYTPRTSTSSSFGRSSGSSSFGGSRSSSFGSSRSFGGRR